MTFKPGDKVRCIQVSIYDDMPGVIGHIYTLAEDSRGGGWTGLKFTDASLHESEKDKIGKGVAQDRFVLVTPEIEVGDTIQITAVVKGVNKDGYFINTADISLVKKADKSIKVGDRIVLKDIALVAAAIGTVNYIFSDKERMVVLFDGYTEEVIVNIKDYKVVER